MVSGNIFDIQHYAVHDGPGIRTLVFMKGCPLKCKWCCNPESQSFSEQLRYASFKCISAYTCIEVCPFQSAYRNDDKVAFHFDICIGCELKPCVDHCNSGALMICGKGYSAKEVVEIIKKDIDFYRNSGGGVTFTGGEPLSQPAFLKAMLHACKDAGIHTAIETCGYAITMDVKEIIPLTDLFLFDLKFINSQIHEKFTGMPNDLILENFALVASSGKPLIVRIPLIHGVTDSQDNLEQIAEVSKKNGVKEINLEPYNPLGEEKYMEFGFPAKPEFNSFYSEVEINYIISFFNEKGFKCLPA